MSSTAVRTPRLRLAVEILVTLGGVALLVWAWRADRTWYETHMLWRSCVVNPKELNHGAAWRWLGVIAGLLAIFVARPYLGRWAGKNTPAELAGQLLRIALALAAALVVGELYLRHKGYKEPTRFTVAFETDDPRVGWRNKASSSTTLPYYGDYGERHVTYTIDAHGNRVPSADQVPDPSLPTILFNGESVTFGFGMPYEQSYPALVEDMLHVQTANISVSAYAIDQEYMRQREELPRFPHAVAIVTLVVPVQLIRVLFDRPMHFLPHEDGSIEERSSYIGWWRRSSLDYLFRNTIDYKSDEGLVVARANLSAMARDARARGVFPLFVLTNWGLPCLPDGTGEPPVERTLFGGLALDVIRVDLDPTWWDKSIDHPDARASARLAEAISEALRKNLVARN